MTTKIKYAKKFKIVQNRRFDRAIIGATYPLPLAKGDYVALGNFLADVSYYIDFNFILRFGAIKKLQPMPQAQGQQQGGKA